MTYDAKSIANFFIEVARKEGKKLTPLQIIKLVYIAHGWHLGLTEKPLINESPQAWKYGPVIPSLYHELKDYGNQPVEDTIKELEVAPTAGLKFYYKELPIPTDENIIKFLTSIWKAYGGLTGIQLSALTHADNTPWYLTWEKEKAKYSKGVDIAEEKIKNHYKGLNDARRAATNL